MLRQKTVFIVGAGASCEVGFPSGKELKSRIAKLIDIKFDDWGRQQKTGDYRITQAFRDFANSHADLRDINPLLHKSWHIAAVIPTAAISIDNYLDAHRGDALLELAGKLGIVKAILDAEAKSPLKDEKDTGQPFDIRKVDGTWYQSLFQQLSENVRRAEVASLFENASFIVFNYDRCVEHVFARLIETYYDLPAAEAQQIMDKVPIIHPYGVVGCLPWQTDKPFEAVPFGANERADLLKSAARIRTFTEGQDDPALMQALHTAIMTADTLVFLGFSYGRQNLTLMTPEGGTEVRRMYGTAFGVPGEEREVIEAEVDAMIRRGRHGIGYPLKMLDTTCAEALTRIGRAITA